MTDYYNILGVTKNSSEDEIKKAYKKLAMKHHPDRGGDTAAFQRIQEAYATLSDPQKKQQYDNPQPQMHGFNFGGGFPPGFNGFDFGSMFGGFGDHLNYAHNRNKSLNVQTTITLEEAFTGKDLTANLKLPSGKNQTISVKIPAGIENGSTLRIHGLGDDSIPNVARGDVNLTIHVLPHASFQRQGDDLVSTIEISCIEAMLGTSVKIVTIDGKALDVKINQGIQPNQIMSVPSYGMPNVNDNKFKGRLLINVSITIPTMISEKQKELLNKFITAC
jgi:DnaJ-class molecular chaperone